MSAPGERNYPASVHARLRQLSPRGEDLNRILQRYAAERFLFRLGASPVADRFILKGASLFLVWNGDVYRGTQDIDLLAEGANTQDAIRRALDIFARSLPEDGVVFDPSSDQYPTPPCRWRTSNEVSRWRHAGNIKLPLQVDIWRRRRDQSPPTASAYRPCWINRSSRVGVSARDTHRRGVRRQVVLGRRNSRSRTCGHRGLATRLLLRRPGAAKGGAGDTVEREALKGTDVAAGADLLRRTEPPSDWSGFRRQIEVEGYEPHSLAEAGGGSRLSDAGVEQHFSAGSPSRWNGPPGWDRGSRNRSAADGEDR